MTIITATATREGTAADNADSAAVYTLTDGTVAAAVIDGIGHAPGTSATVPLLAEAAARVGARRGPLPGILTASSLIADPACEGEMDAVGAVVVVEPDRTRIAWVGDCRVYGWDGERLHQRTTDQTMGEYLRQYGDLPVDLTDHYGSWVRVSLASAAVATVAQAEVVERLIIVTSDGVPEHLAPGQMENLVRAHEAAPQDLADALVAATRGDDEGYRDDATVVVLALPTV